MKKTIICAVLITLMLISLSSVSAVKENSTNLSIIEKLQSLKTNIGKSYSGRVNIIAFIIEQIIDFLYRLIHGSGVPSEGGGGGGPGGP